MTKKKRRPGGWTVGYHLEQEDPAREGAWKLFDIYPSRGKATAAARRIKTGSWRVVEIGARVVFVHQTAKRPRLRHTHPIEPKETA